MPLVSVNLQLKFKTALQVLGSTSIHARRIRLVALGALAAVALLAIAVVVSTHFDRLPDMRSIDDVNARKTRFFEYLAPIVESLNEEIMAQRASLLAIADTFRADGQLSFLDGYRLESLARQYEVEWDESDPGSVISSLRRRVDMVPVALVLVQAAKESGWGTSRFAREGNNLFGQWCYSEGCGIVPNRRAREARHEVRVFDSIEEAISAYLHNINTGEVYRSLRNIRAQLRSAGRQPDGRSLADGLLHYSQRREAYVEEVKMMLDQYREFQQRHKG
jgi:Bax protein